MQATPTEKEWLEAIRAATLKGDWHTADSLCTCARAAFPHANDLCRLQAGVSQQLGRVDEAEALFRQLLSRQADDDASAFGLARLLGQQGRTAAAASVLQACLASTRSGRQPDVSINAVELLDDYGRKAAAAAIAIDASSLAPEDARLHAYAAMLLMQLGEFGDARNHYLAALAHDPRAWEWHVPLGLANAQRYADARHPDFELFAAGLQRVGLSDAARAELRFALGKANDDIGRYAAAAQHLREGNRLLHAHTRWSRKAWRRMVNVRLRTTADARANRVQQDFTPIFIVGVPRTGSTLLARLVSQATPRVVNRGELAWIERIASQFDLSVTAHDAASASARAAAIYTAHVRQDDADEARWFIDKQPLNFRYIDLIMRLFPNARIIHCQRSPRDTALSLWMQCFRDAAHGYAYDFEDMAQVMRDETRLVAHWRARYPVAIRNVHYEELVTQPAAVIARLATWIGLPKPDSPTRVGDSHYAVSTSSLWQARQPIHTNSVARWKHYAVEIPELLRFSE